MIKTKDLCVSYGNTLAVNKLNISIKKGEKVSVVGKSGCGKTSLLHVLAGLVEPSSGEVTISSKKALDRDQTAIILQKDGLFPWKNVEDNMLLGIINSKENKVTKDQKVRTILSELGILEYKHKYLKELSGGQRQRVAIGRALIQSPDLLLMDEPTGSLDMITKEEFQDSLHDLFDHHSMTSIIVTHDIEEAIYLGEKILIMDQGELIGTINNPLYGQENRRNSIEFYELCLKVRQVMKGD